MAKIRLKKSALEKMGFSPTLWRPPTAMILFSLLPDPGHRNTPCPQWGTGGARGGYCFTKKMISTKRKSPF